jgi:hypothetical protein
MLLVSHAPMVTGASTIKRASTRRWRRRARAATASAACVVVAMSQEAGRVAHLFGHRAAGAAGRTWRPRPAPPRTGATAGSAPAREAAGAPRQAANGTVCQDSTRLFHANCPAKSQFGSAAWARARALRQRAAPVRPQHRAAGGRLLWPLGAMQRVASSAVSANRAAIIANHLTTAAAAALAGPAAAGLPVILDCDTGADDAIAILMAAASQRCRLLGVTTCQGNTPVANVRDRTTALCPRTLAGWQLRADCCRRTVPCLHLRR